VTFRGFEKPIFGEASFCFKLACRHRFLLREALVRCLRGTSSGSQGFCTLLMGKGRSGRVGVVIDESYLIPSDGLVYVRGGAIF
jgi:hypothetical protein